MLTQADLEKFSQDGYLVLENFISLEKCKELCNEMDKILEPYSTVEEILKVPVFRADRDQLKVVNDYFLTSTDKIRPFLEMEAVKALQESKNFNRNVFNKVGHALHVLNPTFKQVTFDQNVKDVSRSLGFQKPVVCQSMFIFKQPFIGGEVSAHQDGTFLHTEPLKLFGIWIALEDCTLENGCLSFLPGSHKGPLSRRMIRNPNKEEFDAGNILIFTNDNPKYNDDEFVALPVKAGTAILIDGIVVHKSGHNHSSKSRHIYTFHVYESENTVFSKDNWMEYSPISFLPLYEN